MKRITKSTSHCQALQAHTAKVLAELSKMRATIAGDQTANAGEREADLALVDRWTATFQKANAWWEADIARNAESAKAKAKAKAKEPEQKATKA